ncbi:hypothetical protein B0H15DRAFT_797690 [Mycena belliarum]|uniref:Uncharacterized protein n=1 Tax=Mycena belliarum TaxID=1033014 RepID=A0AAD6UD77_9AGAR|nr:hypothetical protein B0H15DRAFT_797690 [Mycena belliae]
MASNSSNHPANPVIHSRLFRGCLHFLTQNLQISALTITTVVSDEDYADSLAIINSVWDSGLYEALRNLPRLLIHTGNLHNFFRTDRSLEAVLHMKSIRVLFLYFTVPALIPYAIDDTAYAVAFFIPGHDSFQTLHLSYLLIRFMDKYIRDSDYTRFNMLAFSFVLDHTGTYGIILLDKKFRRTYRKAQNRARRNPAKYNAHPFDVPLSTWPSNAADLRDAHTIYKLMAHAQFQTQCLCSEKRDRTVFYMPQRRQAFFTNCPTTNRSDNSLNFDLQPFRIVFTSYPFFQFSQYHARTQNATSHSDCYEDQKYRDRIPKTTLLRHIQSPERILAIHLDATILHRYTV